MRIVHTESSLGWGGQEIRILSESRGLARRGHEVGLLCPREARIFGEAPKWGLAPVPLPIQKKSVAGFIAVRRWLAGNACDVVSTHSSTDSWLVALALASLGRPAPMLRTRHISAPVPRSPLSRWLYTRATSHIVTTGEALKRELVEGNAFPAGRIESVPTGADPQLFRPGDRHAARASLGLREGGPLVGIVATLRSWKGHRYLLEALPANCELLVVGDGPQRAPLEAQAAALGIAPRVRFTGNQANVVPWLQALDVFALPSYANEGVPQALLQAMLVGLPCVTTSVGGIPELARDGETALVVPPRDVAALRLAIQKLLGEGDFARRLGEAARRHCSIEYSYERMLDRMEAAYRRVAEAA